MCHLRPCNSFSIQQSSSVCCVCPHLHTLPWLPHYLRTYPLFQLLDRLSISFLTLPLCSFCSPCFEPITLCYWWTSSCLLTPSLASADCHPLNPKPTFIIGQVNLILSHLPVSWVHEFKPRMSNMNFGYLMLTDEVSCCSQCYNQFQKNIYWRIHRNLEGWHVATSTNCYNVWEGNEGHNDG